MRLRLGKFTGIVAFAALFGTLFLPSCNKDTPSGNVYITGADTVEWLRQNVTLHIWSEGRWRISAEAESGGDGWFTLTATEGNRQDKVIVTLKENDSDLRTVLITVSFDGGSSKTLRLAQREWYDESTQVVRGWMEVPQGWDDGADNVKTVVHYIPEKRDTRSFTIRYNTEWHYPEWVAYPMHINYHSPSMRSDAWAWDPKIPERLQANMTHSMQNGYDRGHMLPSASRTINSAANKQTFYCTNMCCQRNALNAGVWANLEGKVRGWTGRGTDTLYVVTGAVLSRQGMSENFSKTYSRGDTSKPIAVPNYYYKALLKAAGSSYRGIAFWFDKGAGDRAVAATDAISIEELEKRTGITFFPQLPAATAAVVKSELDTSAWGL